MISGFSLFVVRLIDDEGQASADNVVSLAWWTITEWKPCACRQREGPSYFLRRSVLSHTVFSAPTGLTFSQLGVSPHLHFEHGIDVWVVVLVVISTLSSRFFHTLITAVNRLVCNADTGERKATQAPLHCSCAEDPSYAATYHHVAKWTDGFTVHAALFPR